MNRRGFLKALAAVPVAAVLAPLAVKEPTLHVKKFIGTVSAPAEMVAFAPSGAFARALQLEIDVMVRDYKRDLNRQLFMG